MPYKHNQLKDIKKNSQNNSKVICSSSLAILWGLLLSRESFRNKTQEKSIVKKRVINAMSKGNIPFFSRYPVKKSFKARK